MHTGDFEIDGVGYVNRTLEEMRVEVEFWRKAWEGEASKRALEEVLRGGDGEAEETKLEVKDVREEKADDTKQEDAVRGVKEGDAAETEQSPSQHEPESAPAAQPTTQETRTVEPQTQSNAARPKVDNIIVLGLGSLQSARREGRRATLTQLAALETIIKHFGMSYSMSTTNLLLTLSSNTVYRAFANRPARTTIHTT